MTALRETKLRLDRFWPLGAYQLILSGGWWWCGKPPVQPGLGEFQVAVDRCARNVQQLRCFLIGAAQEEPKLEHAHFPLLESFQLIQSDIQREHLVAGRIDPRHFVTPGGPHA